MTDDTIRLNWALTEDSQSWRRPTPNTKPYTTGTIYNDHMILASTDGYVHVSGDGSTFKHVILHGGLPHSTPSPSTGTR